MFSKAGRKVIETLEEEVGWDGGWGTEDSKEDSGSVLKEKDVI